ncbi:response regulator [Pelagicoccus enzymogenes]|uniref:response regulator n=1 Tax=Pelagicoccus enzymogenes TaxID=2773457 RepID=UPI00280E2CBA|nr:response regulator [Pelagicoccus enzymogenes]MDQ8198398.1 response regulator [Pelagicoccus enzymogenes]
MNSSASSRNECQKALLAEDDSLIRELVAHYLQKLGYEVCEAPNGAVALELLEANAGNSFDLIVTDLLMPKASGETVVKHAKAKGACDRFLIMSGNPVGPQDKKLGIGAHSRYIEKPFTFGDFESQLHALVEEPIPQGA